MARRSQQSSDEAVSLDGLMDTMTNVVGTLLLILIIVQLQVSNRASSIEESLSQVKKQQVDEAKMQIEEGRKKLALAESDWEKRKPGEKAVYEALAAKQEDVKRQETTIQERGVKLLSLDELEKQIATRKGEVDLKKKEVAKVIEERTRIQALLDKTPVVSGPPPIDIHVPVSRPLPAKPEYLRILVLSNRLYTLPDTGKVRQFIDAQLGPQKGRILKIKKPEVFDQNLLLGFLQKLPLHYPGLDVVFRLARANDDRVTLELKPLADGGDPVDQIKAFNSGFRAAVDSTRGQPNKVIWFHVHPDSIAAYHEARDECTRLGISAGWEFFGGSLWSERLPYALKEPPPPPPKSNKPPAPPPAKPSGPQITIPPPKKTLD